jgi:hypothetical protein
VRLSRGKKSQAPNERFTRASRRGVNSLPLLSGGRSGLSRWSLQKRFCIGVGINRVVQKRGIWTSNRGMSRNRTTLYSTIDRICTSGSAPRDVDLPRPRLEFPPFLVRPGLLESALKLCELGGVTSPPCPLP